jgi:hypothetical protein
LRIAKEKTLMLEVEESDSLPVVTMPGLYRGIEDEAYCLVINPKMERKRVEKGVKIGEILMMDDGESDKVNAVAPPSWDEKGLEAMEKYVEQELRLNGNKILKSNSELKKEIVDLFVEYQDTISRYEFNYGHTMAIQCQIQLKPGEGEPVKLKARPLNPAQEASVKKQIEEWERSNIIEKTQSPWAFPMVRVKKKNMDSLRWCVNYRLLNRKTIKDAYPLSLIENNLHKLEEPHISQLWIVQGHTML